MPAAKKAAGKDEAAGAPAPAVVPDLTPDQEIAELENRIAVDQARIHQLRNPIIEFPKMVKDRTFASREEQYAAGPEYADA